MKKSIKLILGIIILVVIIIAATFGYNKLSGEYEADNLASEDSDSTDDLEAADDFTVVDADGNDVSLYSKVGKPIVLNFWASWCSPCKSEMPGFESAYAEYGDEVEFMIVNITDGSRETTETASDFIAEQGYTFPVYFDVYLEGVYAYDISSIPATYFIDSDGYISTYSIGAMDEETLIEGIESLLE